MTDTLKNIAENTSHFLGFDGMFDYGKTMKHRYIEIFEEPKKEETRTPDEIIGGIRAKLGAM